MQPTLAVLPADDQGPPPPALWKLLLGLSATGAGAGFFARLAEELSALPGIDLAFVAEVVEGVPMRARTLAFRIDGQPQPAMRFGLAGTPCEGVLRAGLRCYADRVQERFPEDGFFVTHRLESYAGIVLRDTAGAAIGWMAVAGRVPMTDPGLILSALRFAAARTALELRLLRERAPRRSHPGRLALLGEAEGLWEHETADGRMRLSPRARLLLGLGRGAGATDLEELWDRVHAEDRPEARAEFDACVRGAADGFETEFRVESPAGVRWIALRGRAVRGGGGRQLAGSLADVSDRKAMESRLEHAAYHDPLTGLPNRARFLERLEDAMARALFTPDRRFALLYLDLDRFKVVNDSLGHAAGDELLRQAAARLHGAIGERATVGRLGGDEFAVLLEDRTVEQAEAVARRILDALGQAYHLEGNEVFASGSVGLVMGGAPRDSAEALLRDADTALYRAKERGKARYEVFDRGLHDRAVDRLRVEMDLRRAAERGELRVVYQPIVAARRGRVMGFEALLRWQHPTLGTVPPGAFVPVAEETGQIVELGDWVLRAVAGQVSRWRGTPGMDGLAVTVNLSPRQVQDPDLAERIACALAEHHVPAEQIRMEITEGAVLGDADGAIAALRRVRSLGVGVWLDDFGTGYSSLAYLARLPVTALKIDRAFVAQLEACARTRALVRSVVQLARRLRLGVMAEGVETREQLRLLRAARVPLVQGYLAAPPLEPDVAARFARGRLPGRWSVPLGRVVALP